MSGKNNELIERIKEQWGGLDPVDPLRRVLDDVVDVLAAAQPAKPGQWIAIRQVLTLHEGWFDLPEGQEYPGTTLGSRTLYTHPLEPAQPAQNLSCKSTQARLAALWGYVKAQPEQEPVAWLSLTDAERAALSCFAAPTNLKPLEPDMSIRKIWLMTVEMPDGSKWGVPVDVIALDRAKHYASEFDGDISRSLAEDTTPLFLEDDYAIQDWAVGNMNWSDFRGHHYKVAEAPGQDFEAAWVGGKKAFCTLELPDAEGAKP